MTAGGYAAWWAYPEKVRFIASVVHTLVGLVILVGLLFGSTLVLAPPVVSMTSHYPLVYLPVDYEVVEDVTNVFSEREGMGGSGGVGLPQVERSLEAFQENERQGELHFISLDTNWDKVVVDYYDLQPGKVIHTYVVETERPEWRSWGMVLGSYQAEQSSIEHGELVVQRRYYGNFTSMLLVAVAFCIALAVYFVFAAPHIVGWINQLLGPANPFWSN